jgi:hypothetical protein
LEEGEIKKYVSMHIVVHTCHPNSWKMEAEGSRVQGQSRLPYQDPVSKNVSMMLYRCDICEEKREWMKWDVSKGSSKVRNISKYLCD